MKNYTLQLTLLFILLTALSFSTKALTYVSGGIYHDTTWTKANSPYIVTDTVVVFPHVTLTIQPGVIVKFNNNMTLIISSGSLIAVGTSTDSIIFTSNASLPTPSIWKGLTFNSDSIISMNYCKILYGEDNEGTSIKVLIKNSSFYYNRTGLLISEYSNDNDTIYNCTFRENGQGLIASSLNIINCIASNNSANGIRLHPGWIKNCFCDSNDIGIVGGGDSIINCSCTNNKTGILMQNSGELLRSSTVSLNNFGIAVLSILSNPPIFISDCLINFNGIGIFDSGYAYLPIYITKNKIENNNIGLKLNAYYNDAFCNMICNNTLYDFYYDGPSNNSINIEDNYWCTTDSATIASHIYDGYDNVNYGLVTFEPIDTVGCYLTGCNLQLTTTVTNATCDTCHNGQATVNISNGHPPFTYTWQTSPIQTTQTATHLTSGTYSVCVTDGNGCTACTTVFVDSTNCTGYSVAAYGINATCLTCNDGKAWVDVNRGTSPYSYTWYTIPLQNTDTAFNLLHGNYAVCVTDLYGCTACDSVIIGKGSCSAHFDLYPDTAPHQYIAVNMASGAGTLTYDWNWGDGSTHDNTPYPSHTYANAGFYTICLTITDTAGCTDTYCNSFYLLRATRTETMIHVTVIPYNITGLEKQVVSSINIYPNPAHNKLTLINTGIAIGTIKIFDLLGELHLYTDFINQVTDIDISGLSNGIYIIEITADNKTERHKFVKN